MPGEPHQEEKVECSLTSVGQRPLGHAIYARVLGRDSTVGRRARRIGESRFLGNIVRLYGGECLEQP
jgi:hypothetical protein